MNLQASYDADLLDLNEAETITEEELKVYDEIQEVVEYLQQCEILPGSERKQDVILALRKILQVRSLVNLWNVLTAAGFRLNPDADVNPVVHGAWRKLFEIAGIEQITRENSGQRIWRSNLHWDG